MPETRTVLDRLPASLQGRPIAAMPDYATWDCCEEAPVAFLAFPDSDAVMPLCAGDARTAFRQGLQVHWCDPVDPPLPMVRCRSCYYQRELGQPCGEPCV